MQNHNIVKILGNDDIDAICNLIKGDEIADKWSRKDFENAINNQNRLCLYIDNIGFVLLQIVADEAEILIIWTSPLQRKRGYATSIINAAIAKLKESFIQYLFLEVAVNNIAAINLYNLTGFVEIGRRKDYYKDRNGANIDAIVMRREIDA